MAEQQALSIHGLETENRTIAYRASIRDLAHRLKENGFDWSFVRSCVLPDWWRDEMADVDANRVLAEAYIARYLGFNLAELEDRTRPLSFPLMADLRFKRHNSEMDDKVKASAVIALSAASSLVRAIGDELPMLHLRSAREVRDAILRQNRFVDLDSLLSFCWDSGIPVVQLDRTPAGKGFDGMATFAEKRPVIVLASRRDSPPWLAFYVAHELGHLMLGHVRADTEALFDVKITGRIDGDGEEERGADRFALEVLSGFPNPKLKDLKLKAHQLALTAERTGPDRGVDPGMYALIYAWSNDRWAVAQEALKHLGLDTGGKARIAEQMARRLSVIDLPEAEERFLSAVAVGKTEGKAAA